MNRYSEAVIPACRNPNVAAQIPDSSANRRLHRNDNSW